MQFAFADRHPLRNAWCTDQYTHGQRSSATRSCRTQATAKDKHCKKKKIKTITEEIRQYPIWHQTGPMFG